MRLILAAFCLLTFRPALALTLNDCIDPKLKPDERIDICSKVIQAKAPTPEITAKGYQYRGHAWMQQGKLDQALEDFQKGIALAPNDAELYINRATVAYLRKQYPDAIRDLTKAISLNGKHKIALTNRATIYDLSGDANHARRDYDTAVEVSPNDPFTLYNRGVFLLWQGDYAKSIADFDAVLKLAPDNIGALSSRCLARARSGQELRLAEADCGEALRQNPNFGPAYDSRAFIMFRYGAYDDALADYAAAAKINPHDPAALYGRGVMTARLGDKAKGDADLAAARAIDPAIDRKFKTLGVQ